MTALSLLADLRQAGVAFHPEPGGVIALMTPQAALIRALPGHVRPCEIGLYGLVQEYDDYTHVLLDCARMPWPEAEALA
jgi:hypothetical protein